MAEELIDLRLKDFLDETARRCPTPGGGAVAAAVGATACAMARMVVAYSVGKNTEDDKRARVEAAAERMARTDVLMRSLIQEDAVAYSAMTAAAKAAKADASKQGESDAAVLRAIRVPLEIAAVASTLLSGLDDFKADASRYLLSDLGVAAVVGESAARAADYSVRVNAPSVADVAVRGTILAEADAVKQHCQNHCSAIEHYVREHLPLG